MPPCAIKRSGPRTTRVPLGDKMCHFGPFLGTPPPFWPFLAILGHFGHFWPFLALFGPPGPPGAHFRTRIPPHIPENIPAHIGDEKNLRAHPRRKDFPAAHSAQMSAEHFPAAHSAQILPRTNLHKIPPHISAPKIRTQIPRKFSRAHLCTNSPDANSAQTSPEKNWMNKFITLRKKYLYSEKLIYTYKKKYYLNKSFASNKKLFIIKK